MKNAVKIKIRYFMPLIKLRVEIQKNFKNFIYRHEKNNFVFNGVFNFDYNGKLLR